MLEGQDLEGAFKLANLAVGALAILSGLLQLFNGISLFLLGLYITAFGAAIVVLEFRPVTSEVQTYALFMLSFIGRGVFYTLIALMINGALIFRVFALLIIFLVGLGYIGLQSVPLVLAPPNMSLCEGVALDNDDII